MSEDQVAELVAGYRAGETVYVLGERFGVNRKTASEILKREGVKTRYRSIEPDEHPNVIQLYRSGKSLAAVAEVFDVYSKTISNILKQSDVPRRPVGTNQWR